MITTDKYEITQDDINKFVEEFQKCGISASTNNEDTFQHIHYISLTIPENEVDGFNLPYLDLTHASILIPRYRNLQHSDVGNWSYFLITVQVTRRGKNIERTAEVESFSDIKNTIWKMLFDAATTIEAKN